MFRHGLSTDGLHFQAKKFLSHTQIGRDPSKEDQDSRIGLAVDVETTGFDRQNDEVIEVAARLFGFNRISGEIIWIADAFEGLQEPSKKLDTVITRVTGLTDEDLAGHSIDWSKFDALVNLADIIVAHNAAFDRQFIERYTKSTQNKVWGCSFEQIDWSAFPSAKLFILALCHGFYFDSHRALNDVDALLHLINMTANDQETNRYFQQVLASARLKRSWVKAINSQVETKEILRKNGYRWQYEEKLWRKKILNDDQEKEKAFLKKDIDIMGDLEIEVVEIPYRDNFKD